MKLVPARRIAALFTIACLPACVAIGPSIPVTPGPGRTQAAFNEDHRACMLVTDQQVQPVANRSAAATLQGAQLAVSNPSDIQALYNATYGQCMSARGHLIAQPIAIAPARPTPASCSLGGIDMPIGTPIQEMTIRADFRPTVGFSQSRTAVTSASVLSPPCHGTLTATRPIGFRYTSRKDYVGTDMFAIRACNAAGDCSITGMMLTIMQ